MDTTRSCLLRMTLFVFAYFNSGLAYDDFDKDCVRMHNQLRAQHNASALCWSESLARDAQKWAENLASRDRAEHDYQDLITRGHGENIAWITNTVEKCQGHRKPGCVSCRDIVKKWYSEEKNYDFQKGTPVNAGQPIRHFNQVVWKSTLELGVGSARSDQHGLIVVARYSPMGSTGGPSSFIENVRPRRGNSSLDAEAQSPQSQGQTTIIKIIKVVQKIPPGNSSRAVEPGQPSAPVSPIGGPAPSPPSTVQPPPAPVPTPTQAPTPAQAPTQALAPVPGPTETPMTCGIRKPSRIVGGEIAYPGAWPWQTGFKRNADDAIFCGGSLLNKEWIVTASHCVYDMLRANKDTVLIAVLGEFDKGNKEEQEISVKTKKIIMHPKYHSTTFDYDVALVKLETPLKEFSVYIRPVCMPARDEKFDEESKCYVTGFGRTQQGGELAGMLRMAKVPLVDANKCKKAYGDKLTERMICAGFPEGGIDACQGDSGGPLSCLYDGRWFLTGVVSWGVGCAQPNAYGVYAKVQSLNDWVEDTMKDNE